MAPPARPEEKPKLRTEDPRPKKEPAVVGPKDPPAPKKEEPKVDPRLKALLADLRNKRPAKRLQAVEELGKLGEKARPGLEDLCRTLVSDPSQPVSEAALTALEKIYPELHKQIVVLIAEAESAKHLTASRQIAALGTDARGAVPAILAHMKGAPGRFAQNATAILIEDMQTLAQIAPDDATAQKALIDLTGYSPSDRVGRDLGHEVRLAAVRVLGEILDKHQEQAKNVTPSLILATRRMKDPEVRTKAIVVLGTIAENHAGLRPQVATILIALLKKGETAAIAQVARCGRDARDAVPLLRQYRLHPTEAIRTVATEALGKIQDALAGRGGAPANEKPVARKEPPPFVPADRNLPAELRPHVEKLKTGTMEERLRAAQALANLGEKAKPAARALCEAALSTSEKLSRAALLALEKVDSDLQKPVFILLVDAKASNHKEALTKLAQLREQARPALPVLYRRIKVCQEQLSTQRGAWSSPTLVEVTVQILQTVSKVAPEDPEAVKQIIDSGIFKTPNTVFVRRPPGFISRRKGSNFTTTPFRDTTIPLLGEIAEGQPERRKQILPPLVSFIKEAVQTCKSENEGIVLEGIQEVERVGEALLKCGPEAKGALKKEVVPRLQDLQFHKSETVRKKAETLRQKIEDAP